MRPFNGAVLILVFGLVIFAVLTPLLAQIQFNSAEYFTFAAKHPKALPWLALGQNVQFVLDDTLYEIYE